MELTLHLAKGTVALAPHIALEELGLPHDLVWIDFSAGDQRTPAFTAINPKARVPVLSTPHGRLTEAAAIMTWLAATHPDSGLRPADPWDAARVDELSMYLASTVHVNHAHKHRGARWSDDPATWPAMTAKVAENMTGNFALIETMLGDGPWVLGAQYTTADIHLFTVTRWLAGDGVEVAGFPKVAAHFAAMKQRPAVQRVLELHS